VSRTLQSTTKCTKGNIAHIKKVRGKIKIAPLSVQKSSKKDKSTILPASWTGEGDPRDKKGLYGKFGKNVLFFLLVGMKSGCRNSKEMPSVEKVFDRGGFITDFGIRRRGGELVESHGFSAQQKGFFPARTRESA